MSYTKPFTLPSNAAVTVYRIQQLRVDYTTREASAILAAFCDAEATEPLKPVFAKLRLTGERFDAILGKAQLKAQDVDINAALYQALRHEPVTCDAGPDFFRDAEAT